MYRNSLTKNGRCVIVAEGFYEWQTTPGIGNKQPYFVYQDPKVSRNLTNNYLLMLFHKNYYSDM